MLSLVLQIFNSYEFISVLVKQCSPSGPVYVNPNAPAQVVHVQPTKVNRDPSTYETQTVYGFLDFTTTIGNTIMVFSPNSAPPPGTYIIYILFEIELTKSNPRTTKGTRYNCCK